MNIITAYFKRLIIPALFFIISYIIVYGLVLGYLKGDIIYETKSLAIETLYGVISSGSMSNIPCWFLISLFFARIILDVILSFSRTIQLVISLILAVSIFVVHYPFYITQSFLAMPFCFAGLCMSDYVKNLKPTSYDNMSLIIVFIILALLDVGITYYNGRVSMTSLYFGTHGRILGFPLFYINGLIGTAGLIVLSLILSKREFKVVGTISNAMITIICFQWFLIVPYVHFTHYIYNNLIPLIYTAIVFMTSYLIYRALKRVSPVLVGEMK